jgi:hypothetical protein
MIKYFDYYSLNYDILKEKALKHQFINNLTRDEYFLGLERAKKKEYDLRPFLAEENSYEPGSIDWMKEEIRNCKSDIVHFCQYIKIKDPTGGYIQYEPYLFQQVFYKTLNENKYTITDKCRQVGMSVATTVYILWLCMFKLHQTVDIISISDRESKGFLDKLKGTYDSLPKWMQNVPQFIKASDNAHEIKWNNGSHAKSLPKTKDGSRSGSLSLLVFDEAAFIDYMDSQWRGSYFTTSRKEDSKALVISTRNGTIGVGSWYYDKLTGTQQGETDFSLVEAEWWEVPEYLEDPHWLDGAYKNTSRDSFLQEVCKKWLVAGDTVLDKEALLNYPIKEHLHSNIINSEGLLEKIDKLYVFEEPQIITKEIVNNQLGKKEIIEVPKAYAVIADVGTGAAKNYSSFHVFDLDTREQVVEYKNRINTNKYAKILSEVAHYYNDAVLVVERNYPGEAVMSDLINQIKYKNLYSRRKGGKSLYADYGWVTSPKSRPILINALIDDFENNGVKINGRRTIDELLGFIWNERDGKPKASSGNNDDLVISLAILCYLKDDLLSYRSQEQAQITRDDGLLARANVWGYNDKVYIEQFYEENYWLFGQNTQEKIRTSIFEKNKEKQS